MIITAKEYAAKMEVSAASITKRLLKQQEKELPFRLPQALCITKYGNQWRIELADEVPFDSYAAQIDFRKRGKNKVK